MTTIGSSHTDWIIPVDTNPEVEKKIVEKNGDANLAASTTETGQGHSFENLFLTPENVKINAVYAQVLKDKKETKLEPTAENTEHSDKNSIEVPELKISKTEVETKQEGAGRLDSDKITNETYQDKDSYHAQNNPAFDLEEGDKNVDNGDSKNEVGSINGGNNTLSFHSQFHTTDELPNDDLSQFDDDLKGLLTEDIPIKINNSISEKEEEIQIEDNISHSLWKSQALKRSSTKSPHPAGHKEITSPSENDMYDQHDVIKRIPSGLDRYPKVIPFEKIKSGTEQNHIYGNPDAVVVTKPIHRYSSDSQVDEINSQASNGVDSFLRDGNKDLLHDSTDVFYSVPSTENLYCVPAPGDSIKNSLGANDVVRRPHSTYDVKDENSDQTVNFRRLVPGEVQLIRLPYSQFQYGSQNVKKGNGFCLLLANYFIQQEYVGVEEIIAQIPLILLEAENMWDETCSTTVKETFSEFQKVRGNAEFVAALGSEIYWNIDQGIGGNSPFGALHDVYNSCVTARQKASLILTFSPDKVVRHFVR